MNFLHFIYRVSNISQRETYNSENRMKAKTVLALISGVTLLSTSVPTIVKADDNAQKTAAATINDSIEPTDTNPKIQGDIDQTQSGQQQNNQVDSLKEQDSLQTNQDVTVTRTVNYVANDTGKQLTDSSGQPITATVTGKVGDNVTIPTLSDLGKKVKGYAADSVLNANYDRTMTIEDTDVPIKASISKLDDIHISVTGNDTNNNRITREVDMSMYGDVNDLDYSSLDDFNDNKVSLRDSTVQYKMKDNSAFIAPENLGNFIGDSGVLGNDSYKDSVIGIVKIINEQLLTSNSDYMSKRNLNINFIDLQPDNNDGVSYYINYYSEDLDENGNRKLLYSDPALYSSEVGYPPLAGINPISKSFDSVGYSHEAAYAPTIINAGDNQTYDAIVPKVTPIKLVVNAVDENGNILLKSPKVLTYQMYASEFDPYSLTDLNTSILGRELDKDKSLISMNDYTGNPLDMNFASVPTQDTGDKLENLSDYINYFIKNVLDSVKADHPERNNGVVITLSAVLKEQQAISINLNEKNMDGSQLLNSDESPITIPINSSVSDYSWNSKVNDKKVDWYNSATTVTDFDGNTVLVSDLAKKIGIPLTEDTSLDDFISQFVQIGLDDKINDFSNAGKNYTFNIIFKSTGNTSDNSSHSNGSSASGQNDKETIIKKNQTVATTTKEVNLYKKDGSLITDRVLGVDTGWFSDQEYTLNGIKYYRVSTDEFVKAEDVYVYVALDKNIIRVHDNLIGYLLNYRGDKVTDRALQASTDWITDRYTIINGEKYYRVATNEFIAASDVSLV